MDVEGRVVMSGRMVVSGVQRASVKALSAGVYYLVVESEGVMEVKVVVKG
jgi:hypothetical protein